MEFLPLHCEALSCIVVVVAGGVSVAVMMVNDCLQGCLMVRASWWEVE